MEPHKHCHFCGESYDFEIRRAKEWPRACEACGERVWCNPTPVIVSLVEFRQHEALLVVRRDIEPEKGELAFPGGYIDRWETWQEAAARELNEETSGLVQIEPKHFQLLGVENATNGNLLIFCASTTPLHHIQFQDIRDFNPNSEVSELKVIDSVQKLAWETHTKWARRYFEGEPWPTPSL